MTDDDTVDPSDTVDTDAQDWQDERTRLLTDGRVTAMTDAEFAADHAARLRASALRQDFDAIHAASDWRRDGRWVA